MLLRLGSLAFIVLVLISTGNCEEDLPCRGRDVGIEGRSKVCVCDASYCDTITREDPEPGTYVAYTSSNAGQRFEKSYGVIEIEGNDSEDVLDESIEEPEQELPESAYEDSEGDNGESLPSNVVMRIFRNVRHQYIEGFGGSVTDAASINWRKLSDGAQTQFIKKQWSRTSDTLHSHSSDPKLRITVSDDIGNNDTYFGPKGLEYNMIRVPIGGCDFSEYPYTYNEYPWHDATLSNFSLTDEDYFFKLPMIKRSQRVATDEIKVTASTWSPPIWMKTNEAITGFGQLRPEYYQAYANYHLRFIEEYAKAEVKIWALTTTNEPLNGIIPVVDFNSLGWTPAQLGRWVANNLGPTIRNSRFNDTLILAVDDQRYILPIWIAGMEREDPKSIEYIDGLAIHYYGNFFPAQILTQLQRRYPNKILLSTEACEGPMPWDIEKVVLGSWRRARRYTTSILQDLNNFVVGWIDWNLCLDPNGGPNWADNFVDAPILVYGDRDEFIKQPMFYAMGHFSKFIPRGSRRIRVSRRSLLSVENVAVLKPNGNIVLVLQNRRERELNIKVRLSRQNYVEFKMEPQSIKTVEINPN